MKLKTIKKIDRSKGHGWWNCEECRSADHEDNWSRIINGYFTNYEGKAYHPEYLVDLLQWLESKELYEECQYLVQFIPIYEGFTNIDMRPFLEEKYNADSKIFTTYG